MIISEMSDDFIILTVVVSFLAGVIVEKIICLTKANRGYT